MKKLEEVSAGKSFLDCAQIWGFDANEKFNFYYDESNNCRKFWVREKDGKAEFNVAPNEDFVLAGVVCGEIIPELDLDILKQRLKLQKNVTAIKFKKHFAEKTFLDCMDKERVKEYLNILEESNLYIHFQRTNNLYYAIVEILDSIVSIDEMEEFGFEYFHIKSTFYKMLVKKSVELQELMYKYCYPNIKKDEIDPFCKQLCALCGNRIDMNPEEKFISGMIERAGKSPELVFLHDNMDHVMQENYIEFYANRVMTFSKSQHVFDKEDEILKRWDSYSLINEFHNYKFVKDEEEILVQLSDVISGILGKFFIYLNTHDMMELRRDINKLTALQVKNIKLLEKMIIESNRRSIGFIQSITAQYEVDKMNVFFEMVCAR